MTSLQVSRDGRRVEMTGAITDEIFDQLVPSGIYDEMGAILSGLYGR
jgi:hypothetical protein